MNDLHVHFCHGLNLIWNAVFYLEENFNNLENFKNEENFYEF